MKDIACITSARSHVTSKKLVKNMKNDVKPRGGGCALPSKTGVLKLWHLLENSQHSHVVFSSGPEAINGIMGSSLFGPSFAFCCCLPLCVGAGEGGNVA
jgi:hypothetical protein